MAVNTRDILRKAVNHLKLKFDVKIEKAELSSIEDCYKALEKVVVEANKHKVNETLLNLCEDYRNLNFNLRLENNELKKEIEKLKTPKKHFIKKFLGLEI